MQQSSDISFESYAAWCRSRVPPIDPGEGPVSDHKTELATGKEDACPVTIRSVYNDCVVVTPRPQGSR
jgi:hypothetical protein